MDLSLTALQWDLTYFIKKFDVLKLNFVCNQYSFDSFPVTFSWQYEIYVLSWIKYSLFYFQFRKYVADIFICFFVN